MEGRETTVMVEAIGIPDDSDCAIEMFFHCSKCMKELPEGMSPSMYQSLSVGFTANYDIQVWCNRHNAEVGTFVAEDTAKKH